MKRLSLLVAVLATLCLAQAEPQEPVEVPQIAKFKLDLISGSEGDPTSGWWSITGGESNFEWVDFTESPDPQEQPSGQFWTFKLITTDLEDPPFNISGYETVTIDLGPAPIFQSFLMLLDPLNRIVYYPSGIVPPGDDVRSYAGIVLGTYKTSGDDPSGGGFVYITNLLTNNVSVWDSNPDHFVIAIDVGAGPIGITASDNPAHIAQTVLDEAIMVQGVNPDDNCELSCEENQTNCRRRVRVERKECRAKCRFDPDPRPCLRDCLITAREAMRQCKKQVAQICAESCSLSLKQVESF